MPDATTTHLTLLTRPAPTPFSTTFLPVHFRDPLVSVDTSITLPASPTTGWLTGMPSPLTKTDPELDLATVGLAEVEAAFMEGEDEQDMLDYEEAVRRDDGKRKGAATGQRVGWLVLCVSVGLGFLAAVAA